MGNKIPTAEELLWDRFNQNFDEENNEVFYPQEVRDLMQEFAKFHVEAALKAAHDNSQFPIEDLDYTLSCYPLENIK